MNEHNYPAHKLEFLALKWAVVDKFRDYLYGNKFEVRTDNNPLTYILTTAKLDATSHRWLAALSSFNFSLRYRSGKTNVDADTLSRLPSVLEPSVSVLFSDVVKAVCQASLVPSDRVRAAECISLSQHIAHPESDMDFPSDSKFSSIDWKMEQSLDATISRTVQILSLGHSLTSRQLALEPELVRSLLHKRNHLFVRNGILYRRGKVSGHLVEQLVLPQPFHDIVFTGLHDDAGHQSRERTISLVKSRFFWLGLEQFIARRIRECPRCMRLKTPVNPVTGLVPIESTYPLELLCVDFLTLDMSKGGYEQVLIMTDHFTRFAQAIPTKNETAHTTAKAIFDNFVVHYCFPSRLHIDQGRNFEGAVIKELCKIANIEKSRKTPYHPQGNGMAEKFNQTLMNMIGTLEEKQKSNWKAHIPSLVHAYNFTRHESTGLTPY